MHQPVERWKDEQCWVYCRQRPPTGDCEIVTLPTEIARMFTDDRREQPAQRLNPWRTTRWHPLQTVIVSQETPWVIIDTHRRID
jgi:hypothetical protein